MRNFIEKINDILIFIEDWVSNELNILENRIHLHLKQLPSNSNKEVVSQYINQIGNHFNCWGATSLYFKKIHAPRWITEEEMTGLLISDFTKQEDPCFEINDVLVMREEFEGGNKALVHTAVYIGNNTFWHKRGRNLCEFVSLNKVKRIYFNANIIERYKVVSR